MNKKMQKSEEDEITLIKTGKICDFIEYTKNFALHDRAVKLLLTPRFNRKARAFFASITHPLSGEMVSLLLETQCDDNIEAYFNHYKLGLANEYILAQTAKTELIARYEKIWGFRSIMARHYLADNHLVSSINQTSVL